MFHASRRVMAAGAMLLCGLLLFALGCTQKMAEQPAYRPYQPSTLFADGSSARPVPDDTVARGQLQVDQSFVTGQANGADVTTFPMPLTDEVLARGRSRFDIFCSPCHGYAGGGDGVVVQRGFTPPPSLHIDRLRQAAIGHFVQVMTTGFGAMPSYASQIQPSDRWAIAAYIRALQLSQNAPLDVVPTDERSRLEQTP